MNLQFEIAIIGLFQAVIVAVIAGMFARDSRRQKKSFEKERLIAALRREESLLALELTAASVNLGVSTAIAVRDNKTNGIMESALNKAGEAERDYQAFVNKLAANQIADSAGK